MLTPTWKWLLAPLLLLSLLIPNTANANLKTVVDHCVSRAEFHKIDRSYFHGSRISKREVWETWGASGRSSNVFTYLVLRRAFKYQLCGVKLKNAYAFAAYNKSYTHIYVMGYTFNPGALKNWE